MNGLFIKQLSISDSIPKENYISDIPAVKNLIKKETLQIRRPVTFFVGENGIGKSTLIEAIAVNAGFNPEGGTVNFNFSTRQSHSDLYRYLLAGKGTKRYRDGFFLRAESFFNVATNIEDMDREPSFEPPVITHYGGVSLHEQSHGESFLALVENRFSDSGLYILDEPEAALSPTGIMRLMCNIDRLTQSGSQFIISTHSPILMAYPNADIYEITQSDIKLVPYKETGHYSVTKEFINNPDAMLRVLLRENEKEP